MRKIFDRIPVLLLVIFLLGTIIRFTNLTGMILYWDEPIHSVRIDYQPLSYVLAHNNAGAFFAVMVHFLLPLGNLELAARLPSAAAGCLLIPAVFFLGMTFFSRKTGLIAAAVTAFSPFLIRFSQYSRAYSLFILFVVLSLCCLGKAVKEGSTKYWIGYGLFSLPAFYAHLMGFLTLSGLSLGIGMLWVKDRFLSRSPRLRKSADRMLLGFVLATFAALAAAVLLYLPDENAKGFLSASVDRVQKPLPFFYLASYLIKKIFSTQWQIHGWSYLPLLIFLALGIAAGWKKQARSLWLFLLYITIPFLIFIRINPREVNIQSAPRYFIFILPVFILLAARGIEALSAVFAGKKSTPRSQFRVAAAAAVLTIGILAGFDLGHYYRNFWRLGSFPISKEVRACLEENAKQDGLIFFNHFPVSGQTLIINPLTRDPAYRDSEQEIRRGLSLPEGQHPVMIYRGVTPLAELAGGNIGVWAVMEPTITQGVRMEPELETIPDVRIFPLTSRILFHFQRKQGTLGDNLIDMAAVLLAAGLEKAQERELRLLRIRIYLYHEKWDEAFREMEQVREEELMGSDLSLPRSGPVFRLLDPLFGIDPESMRRFYQEYYFHQEIGIELFRKGEAAYRNKDFPAAVKAYREAVHWNREFDRAISNRLTRIANLALEHQELGRALPLYRQAAELNSQRPILQFLIGDVLAASGESAAARKHWSRALSSPVSSGLSKRLEKNDPLILLSREGRFWRIFFRAPRETKISGEIRSRDLTGLEGDFFNIGSDLKFSPRKILLAVQMDGKKLKSLRFRSESDSPIECEFRINGLKTPQNILLLPEERSPDTIPFFLNSEEEK